MPEFQATTASAPRIAVLGSINMDLVLWCPELPVPGETILAEASSEFCGGKGANQAVAAALAGGQVSMVGAVGDDAFSSRLIAGLQRHGIDCRKVSQLAGSSGLAVIAVDRNGENCIVVAPGANARLSLDAVNAAEALIAGSDLLMVQLEIPVDRVVAATEIARRHQVPVILDPAPAPAVYPPELLRVDLLCPNETEAASLTGRPVGTLEEVRAAAEWLHAAGAEHVAITLGAMGTCLLSEGRFLQIEPYPVEAIDTTAAGDAFAGALAVRWRQTGNLVEAIQFANAAGALAASRRGAQASMADFHEIETWMRNKV